MFDYWFTQFNFPADDNKPYSLSSQQMVYNPIIKRKIPYGWSVENIAHNHLCSFIKPSVDPFTVKEYLATANVYGTSISTGEMIEYETRESRANMQPRISTVWFAKMKNSVKHLFFNEQLAELVENTILSTGFCGLQCSNISFEYIASFINHPLFEVKKDSLAHGATQEAVNNDDLESIYLVIPTDKVLNSYHNVTAPLFAQVSNNIQENRKLQQLRDFLLPMLMNGQATIVD